MDNLDFLSGREKLVGGIPPFSMEDWPKVRSSILWERIESQYGLSLPELCAVKNVVCIESDHALEEVIKRVLRKKFRILESSPATPISGVDSAAIATARPLFVLGTGDFTRPYLPPSKARQCAEHIRQKVAEDDCRDRANEFVRIEYHRSSGLVIYDRPHPQAAAEFIVHQCDNTHRELKDVAFVLALCNWDVQHFKVYKEQNGGVLPNMGGELSPKTY